MIYNGCNNMSLDSTHYIVKIINIGLNKFLFRIFNESKNMDSVLCDIKPLIWL